MSISKALSGIASLGETLQDSPMSNFHGYSLFELLITLAIIAILSSVAYPLYTHHMTHARRQHAETILLNIADQLETYRSEHGSYKGASLSTINIKTSEEPYYRFLINLPSDQTYVVNAIPQKSQTQDECGALTINEIGSQQAFGRDNVDCWY